MIKYIQVTKYEVDMMNYLGDFQKHKMTYICDVYLSTVRSQKLYFLRDILCLQKGMLTWFSPLTDHQYLQLQTNPAGILHRPPLSEVRDPARLEGKWFQCNLSCGKLLPPLGRSLWGNVGRVLHTGATLRWKMGLS